MSRSVTDPREGEFAKFLDLWSRRDFVRNMGATVAFYRARKATTAITAGTEWHRVGSEGCLAIRKYRARREANRS